MVDIVQTVLINKSSVQMQENAGAGKLFCSDTRLFYRKIFLRIKIVQIECF